MSPTTTPSVITRKEAKVERFPWGPLEWLCRPDILDTEEILVVRVNVAKGKGQSFHRQPSMEEVIYVLHGKAEVWLGEQPRTVGPGEAVHVPRDAVHATFNAGAETLQFLSIFAPAHFKGPALVDLSEREPWKSLASERAAARCATTTSASERNTSSAVSASVAKPAAKASAKRAAKKKSRKTEVRKGRGKTDRSRKTVAKKPSRRGKSESHRRRQR